MTEYFKCLVAVSRGPVPEESQRKSVNIPESYQQLALEIGAKQNDTPPPQPSSPTLDEIFAEEKTEEPFCVPVPLETKIAPEGRPMKRRRVVDLTTPPSSPVPVPLDQVLEPDQLKPAPKSLPALVETPEEPFDWREATVLLQAGDETRPVQLSYRSMVNTIRLLWPTEYRKRTRLAWYLAVRRWCIKNGLSLRKVNRVAPVDPRKVADEIRALRAEVRRVILEGSLQLKHIANLDETCLQLFSDMIRTLHYKGAKSVPGNKENRRLYLNITVIWWADGRMDFVCVYKSTANEVQEYPVWERLGNGAGVYWLKAPSKWTNMKTYPEILRALLGMECKLYTDDWATCHGPPIPDNMLESIGGTRLRIPKNGTSLCAPGDRPQDNQKVKELYSKLVEDQNVRALLEQNFENCLRGNSFTEKTRELISNILVQVREGMKKSRNSKGIQNSFMETILPKELGGCMHKELGKFLKMNQPREHVEEEPEKRFACPNFCGARYNTLKPMANHYCWQRRERLLCPVPRRSPAKLNKEWFVGLIAETKVYKEGRGYLLRIFLGDKGHFNLDNGKDLYGERQVKWWWKCGKIRYKMATDEEKNYAKAKGWVKK